MYLSKLARTNKDARRRSRQQPDGRKIGWVQSQQSAGRKVPTVSERRSLAALHEVDETAPGAVVRSGSGASSSRCPF